MFIVLVFWDPGMCVCEVCTHPTVKVMIYIEKQVDLHSFPPPLRSPDRLIWRGKYRAVMNSERNPFQLLSELTFAGGQH